MPSGRLPAQTAAAYDSLTHPTELRVQADLREGSAELNLVRRKTLTGLSVEFRALTERRDPSGLRIVERAELPAIGLVDRGSYRTDIEVRAAMKDAWLSSRIRTKMPMECICSGPECKQVVFIPGAFDGVEKARDILAVGGGGFSNVLGSTRRGTLLLRNGPKGLDVGLTDAATDTARRVVEAAGVADIYARPLLALEESEYVDEGDTRTFQLAAVRAILIKPTPNAKGHTPARIRGAKTRQRRIWL